MPASTGRFGGSTSAVAPSCTDRQTEAPAGAASAVVQSPPRPLVQEKKVLGYRQTVGLIMFEPYSSKSAFAFLCLLVVTIAPSTLNFFLSTRPELHNDHTINVLEFICAMILTTELVLRTWVGTLNITAYILYDWRCGACARKPFEGCSARMRRINYPPRDPSGLRAADDAHPTV